MKNISISKGQIWTKRSPTGKTNDRNYVVKEVFADDDVDTLVVLRDFDSNNPTAQEAHKMLDDPSWIYLENASIKEEIQVVRTIDFGEDVWVAPKPKKKKKKKEKEVQRVFIPVPEKKEATSTGVNFKREGERICAETQSKGKNPTQIAKALANAKVNPAEEKVVPTKADEEEYKEVRDWNTFSHYRYDQFDIFATILRDTKTVTNYNIVKGDFKNGFYKLLHSQALAMWKDGEMSLNQIRLKQPTKQKNEHTGEFEWKPCGMHTFVLRILKAIHRFGTIEEKKAVFKTFN
jgi:hypothetical protein